MDGVHGDNCHTFYAGSPSPAARALVDCTHELMMQAIAGGFSRGLLITRVALRNRVEWDMLSTNESGLLGNIWAACGPGVPFDVIGHIIASGAKKEGFGVSLATLSAGSGLQSNKC